MLEGGKWIKGGCLDAWILLTNVSVTSYITIYAYILTIPTDNLPIHTYIYIHIYTRILRIVIKFAQRDSTRQWIHPSKRPKKRVRFFPKKRKTIQVTAVELLGVGYLRSSSTFKIEVMAKVTNGRSHAYVTKKKKKLK
jgi:hypothetical protein